MNPAAFSPDRRRLRWPFSRVVAGGHRQRRRSPGLGAEDWHRVPSPTPRCSKTGLRSVDSPPSSSLPAPTRRSAHTGQYDEAAWRSLAVRPAAWHPSFKVFAPPDHSAHLPSCSTSERTIEVRGLAPHKSYACTGVPSASLPYHTRRKCGSLGSRAGRCCAWWRNRVAASRSPASRCCRAALRHAIEGGEGRLRGPRGAAGRRPVSLHRSRRSREIVLRIGLTTPPWGTPLSVAWQRQSWRSPAFRRGASNRRTRWLCRCSRRIASLPVCSQLSKHGEIAPSMNHCTPCQCGVISLNAV